MSHQEQLLHQPINQTNTPRIIFRAPDAPNTQRADTDTNDDVHSLEMMASSYVSHELTDTPIEILSESLDENSDANTTESDDVNDDIDDEMIAKIISPTFLFGKDYYFTHIFNGIIFSETSYYPMIEFKIVKINPEAKEQILFRDTQFKCGWFIMDAENLNLRGPVNLNKIKIETGIREIEDENFPEINGFTIEAISNEKESLITREDIPHWMIKHMICEI